MSNSLSDAPAATMILLSYNQADIISDSITSLLNQECDPLEILISDDCSDDMTWEKIVEVVSGYRGPHTIRLNRNAENLGLIKHFNKCISIASANIVIACGGDDISFPCRAKKIVDKFNETNALLVFSDVDKYSLNDKSLADRILVRPPSFYINRSAFTGATSIALYVGASAAYHKDLFAKYGYLNDESVYEDLILGFRASLEGRAEMITEKLVQYRIGGMTTNHAMRTTDLTNLTHRISETKKHISVYKIRLRDVFKLRGKHIHLIPVIVFYLIKRRFRLLRLKLLLKLLY